MLRPYWPITNYRGTIEARATQPSPGVAAADPTGGCAGVRRGAVVGCNLRYRGDAGEMIKDKLEKDCFEESQIVSRNQSISRHYLRHMASYWIYDCRPLHLDNAPLRLAHFIGQRTTLAYVLEKCIVPTSGQITTKAS